MNSFLKMKSLYFHFVHTSKVLTRLYPFSLFVHVEVVALQATKVLFSVMSLQTAHAMAQSHTRHASQERERERGRGGG
jgi:hypothetical protein